MTVTRIAEKPRVTYPFSDEAWAALDALGEKVDRDLASNDVRLTMGGEPTFVSIDDYQSAEWNTAALGPTKRIRADELIRRLRQRFAPGGLLHYGQGKWYPGEPLPRWAFALYWRRDGKPIWHNAALIAPETKAHRPLADDAQRFTQAVAARLGLDADYVQPAFEDPARAHAQGGRAARECRPERSQDRRSGRARPHHARVRTASRRARRLRAAACSAGQRKRHPAGSARCGRRGGDACSWCRETLRSAFACRSALCRICGWSITRISCPPTQ